MFGRATIRLGIGPHSSLLLYSLLIDRPTVNSEKRDFGWTTATRRTNVKTSPIVTPDDVQIAHALMLSDANVCVNHGHNEVSPAERELQNCVIVVKNHRNGFRAVL